MDLSKLAVIFIGYQNDYFATDGILRGVIEESDRTNNILEKSQEIVEKLKGTDALMIQTPIIFTSDYSELINPVGILKTISEVGAFAEGSPGSEIIPEFQKFGDIVQTVEGKRGLNAFSDTNLASTLSSQGVEQIVLAGAVTSICIDSTGRAAHERGFQVTVLSDCTASRTVFEQEFYCENVFPLYSEVISAQEFLDRAVG